MVCIVWIFVALNHLFHDLLILLNCPIICIFVVIYFVVLSIISTTALLFDLDLPFKQSNHLVVFSLNSGSGDVILFVCQDNTHIYHHN